MCVYTFPNTHERLCFSDSCTRSLAHSSRNLKIQRICTGYHFHQEISSHAQQCQWANPPACCEKVGYACLSALPPPHSAPALLQWSYSSRPGHGVRTTNKGPAMPLKMYGMSNCWFSILASLLSRLPRGRTMLRLSAGGSESTRLARAQGSGWKEVAVVDADIVFSLHFVSWLVFRTGNSKLVKRRRDGLLCKPSVWSVD